MQPLRSQVIDREDAGPDEDGDQASPDRQAEPERRLSSRRRTSSAGRYVPRRDGADCWYLSGVLERVDGNGSGVIRPVCWSRSRSLARFVGKPCSQDRTLTSPRACSRCVWSSRRRGCSHLMSFVSRSPRWRGSSVATEQVKGELIAVQPELPGVAAHGGKCCDLVREPICAPFFERSDLSRGHAALGLDFREAQSLAQARGTKDPAYPSGGRRPALCCDGALGMLPIRLVVPDGRAVVVAQFFMALCD